MKRATIVGLVVGAGLLLSGCFWVLVGYNFSDLRLKPGEKTVATLQTHPTSTEGTRHFVFFYVSYPDDGIGIRNPRRFDVQHQFTRRGIKLVRDDSLRDFLRGESGECAEVPTDSKSQFERVYRTQRRVPDRGKPQWRAISKIGFKQTGLRDSTIGGVGIAAGVADTDKDGAYEPGDTFCMNSMKTALWTKRAPSRTDRSDRAEVEALQESLGDN